VKDRGRRREVKNKNGESTGKRKTIMTAEENE